MALFSLSCLPKCGFPRAGKQRDLGDVLSNVEILVVQIRLETKVHDEVNVLYGFVYKVFELIFAEIITFLCIAGLYYVPRKHLCYYKNKVSYIFSKMSVTIKDLIKM